MNKKLPLGATIQHYRAQFTHQKDFTNISEEKYVDLALMVDILNNQKDILSRIEQIEKSQQGLLANQQTNQQASQDGLKKIQQLDQRLNHKPE